MDSGIGHMDDSLNGVEWRRMALNGPYSACVWFGIGYWYSIWTIGSTAVGMTTPETLLPNRYGSSKRRVKFTSTVINFFFVAESDVDCN